jgi:hypothetical protein
MSNNSFENHRGGIPEMNNPILTEMARRTRRPKNDILLEAIGLLNADIKGKGNQRKKRL